MDGCVCEAFIEMEKGGQSITSTPTSQDHSKAWVAHF
jgi:hypothetical protein